MAAIEYDFTDDQAIEQGASWFRRQLVYDDSDVLINLTGYTARMQIRASRQATTVLAEFTTENGGIVLGGAAGTLDLVADATDTAAYTWRKGVYDIELIAPDGFVTRLMRGRVAVDLEVTR